MWLLNSKDQGAHRTLFLDLYQECRYVAPGARLSYQLRHRLERLTPDERKQIVNGMRDGCSPLFLACKRGHVEIVEYLISTCGADIEQRGLYEVPDDRSSHYVTPLWCAAVSGKLAVIKCLVRHGADINAISDTGSTPVRSACFMTHLDIVMYLVENGADIQKSNFNGGTCLINSVQSVELCVYLLCHGAEVNAKDVQSKTALHYAIQEHRLETTKLLLKHGADPYTKSRYNDDALQTACLKGALHIFNHLIATVCYPPERLADAHELIGSTYLDEHNEAQTAIRHWQIAAAIRHAANPPIPKLPQMPTRNAFRHAREFQSESDLRALGFDFDALRIQSLLICERVLGPHHKDSVFRLMYRGAAYADALCHQRCIELWRRALEIRVEKDTIFYNDTCFTAQALVRLYIDLNDRGDDNTLTVPNLRGSLPFSTRTVGPRFEDVSETFTLLLYQIPEAQRLLQIQPVHRKQQESFDRILRCMTHLIYLLMKISVRDESDKVNRQRQMKTKQLVRELLSYQPRSAIHGESLLHLCVSRLNSVAGTYFAEQVQRMIFPNADVIELLLECGAHPNPRNMFCSTPLHIASNSYNLRPAIIETLLKHGAHFDLPNCCGETPRSLLRQYDHSINLVRFDTLKCLAASAVIYYAIPYEDHVPATLQVFLDYHQKPLQQKQVTAESYEQTNTRGRFHEILLEVFDA